MAQQAVGARRRRAQSKATPDVAGETARPGYETRIAGLDAARGIAIVAMIVYHFCFDLRAFGITRSDFENDWRWLAARASILSSFLIIAGVSAVLTERQSFPAVRWLRHVVVIAVAAGLVSAGSALVFPQSFIWFGVLHAIAVSLLVARPLFRRPALAAMIGAVMVLAGSWFSDPAFDGRSLGWVGFMTHKPLTEDYVPLFPWTGVLLLGIPAGHYLVRTRFQLLAPLARTPRWIRWLGRHGLLVYLVHQPILMGLLWTYTRLAAR